MLEDKLTDIIMEVRTNENDIEFSQEFFVSAEKLYEAWTETEQLQQWWFPMDDSLIKVTNDLRVNGKILYEFQKNEFLVSGTYTEVIPNQKLVYNWNWKFFDNLPDEDYVLTIGFEANGESSILHVKQEGLLDAEITKPHNAAWKTALENLKSYLEKTGSAPKPNVDLKSDEGASDRSGGYNEDPEQVKVGGA